MISNLLRYIILHSVVSHILHYYTVCNDVSDTNVLLLSLATVTSCISLQGYSNRDEAEMVMRCAVKLARQYEQGTSIKIITFYNKQRSVLLELLKERQASSAAGSYDNIGVYSIDACQVSRCQQVSKLLQ
jgi:AAA domain